MQFLKRYYGLIIVLILSFWAIRSFFIPGFFPMHDDTQVARVFEMAKVLKAGVFPVRIVPDLGYGYGYPIFNYYAPLSYYVGAGFVFLGFDALIATKLMMALGVVLAGIFMYLLAREFFGEFGGIVSGLFYLYAPYHAVDIYVRGDVAEFYAYAFIPLMFLGIYKKNILIGSIGFAAIILSHNLTAMMIAPFLLIAILLNSYSAFKNKKSFILNYSSLIFIFGLAISAFYWVPALLEINKTNVFSQIGGGADFRDHFVCIGQLWDSLWGFGGSVAGCTDGLSFKIGKLHILSVAASVLILIYLKLKHKHFNNIYYLSILGIAGFLISFFLMLDVSKFIWQAISIMAFFQYPWRFLILASFFSSLLAGSLIFLARQLNIKPYLVAFPLVFFLLFFNSKLFIPQTILPRTAADYTNEYALKWTASKISDEYLPPDFKKPKNQNDVYKGKSNIRVQETPVEKISNAFSLVGLLALILGIIFYTSKRKYE
ncbi:MAG: 6-pyruvoyl-tetrahydropterin synthase-related protein [bacterium]|nr:6-pyruvoyl-tetrahydropterin synthase-related protein [bacterium]